MLLALTVLLSLAAIAVEGQYTCTFEYDSINSLPSCFFQPLCGLNHQLASGYNTYKRVYTTGYYRYYGLNYRRLTVDVSGHLLFGHGSLAPIHPYYSLSLNKPKCQRYDLIGVYWAAHDTRYCGKVCYGETTSWSYRLKFRNLVHSAFLGTSGFIGFWPTHLFMVTYFNVDSLHKPCCRPASKPDPVERSEERRGKKGNKLDDGDDEEEFDDEELDKGYAKAAELEDEAEFKGKLKEDAGDREEPDNKAADSDERPDVEEPQDADSKSFYYHSLNTYQIVMGTNGVHTYVALIYMTADRLWTTYRTHQSAGFWSNWSPMNRTYAFRWSWTDYLYFLRYYGNPYPSGGCSTYVFRLDQFWPNFIGDPKPWMTKYGYRTRWRRSLNRGSDFNQNPDLNPDNQGCH